MKTKNVQIGDEVWAPHPTFLQILGILPVIGPLKVREKIGHCSVCSNKEITINKMNVYLAPSKDAALEVIQKMKKGETKYV